MKVELIDYMGWDITVVNAARASFAKESSFDEAGYLTDKDVKLIKFLAEHKHWSPFSHPQISFRVRAPIFVARQLAKHQVGGAWNEVSRRYVDDEPSFYVPEFWREQARNVKQGSGADLVPEYVVGAAEFFESAKAFYNDLLDSKICFEQARMVLPQAMMTEWIWTGSLFFWARVCRLRLDEHTQAETRVIAQRINDECEVLFPVSWEALMGAPSNGGW